MKTTLLVPFFTLLIGCAAQPPHSESLRSAPTKIEARIATGKQLAFSDCVMDGFDRAHFVKLIGAPIVPRQYKRADGYKIDAIAYDSGAIVASVEIFDSGDVRFIETAVSLAHNTSGERETISDCLKKFQRSNM